jgi:N-acetylmuramoyl-L-alanine amidase
VVNGQPVRLTGEAIIQDGIVMAPYQGLFEPMGIRATWDVQDHTLTLVTLAGDEMQLRTNDPYATVNGERRPIPIPLVATIGQILIPVQWVFDTLGDVTVYNPGARTLVVSAQITAISWRAVDQNMEITLDGTGPLHAAAALLHAPDRIVVDVAGAVPKLAQPSIDVHEGSVGTIRIHQQQQGTRVVFDLTAPVRYRLLQNTGSRRFTLALTPAQLAGGASGYSPGALKITDIAYERVDGGGRVVIMATQPASVTQHILRNPDRIVLDARDAVFIPVKKALNVDDGLVVQVRAAQFQRNPNVVRIVVELTRPAPFAVRAGPVTGQMLVDLGAAAAGVPGLGGPSGPHGPVVVALDAGHGGSDPGAIGPTGLQEKEVTLAIAQDLRTLLQRQHIDVVMVRDADVFVPLEDRAQIAAKAGATLFISIHANAAVDSNANGTQAFYAWPQSVALAGDLLDEMSRAVGLVPRGVMQARFKVLVDNPRIPAVLVETAFISNAREEQMLRAPATQQKFAQGLLQGIVKYLAAPVGSPQ